MPLLDAAFSLPTVEEILERLSAEGAGTLAARSLETLKRASPSSLKVALRQIRTGATLPTLADCLQMEFRLVHVIILDFFYNFLFLKRSHRSVFYTLLSSYFLFEPSFLAESYR